MRRAVLLVALALSAIAQTTIQLDTVVRDFTPAHPDFEHYLGDSRGAVGDTLDQDGKPFLRPGGWPSFTSPTAFAQWYRDTAGVNQKFTKSITLTETAVGSGIFLYDNQNYFPIDNEGFGNYASGHNYHFTTEVHTTFTLFGTENFVFQGDDDLWVYINNKLALDLGGVHGAETGSIDLTNPAIRTALGITVGQDYNLDIFGAERHTSASTFKITTSLKLVTVPQNPSPGRDVYICGVHLGGFGAGEINVPVDPAFRYFTNQDSAQQSFDNFNAIVFGDFITKGGDTEGRLALQGSFTHTLENGGYSVGQETKNKGSTALDVAIPYAFIAGGNIAYRQGSIKPDGTIASLTKEDGFVGATVLPATSAGIAARITGHGTGPTTLDADFNDAKAFYVKVSNSWAARAANAVFSVQFGGGKLVCNNPNDLEIVVNVQTAAYNTISYFNDVTNCNIKAQFVFNLLGTEDVSWPNDGFQFGNPVDFNLLPNKPAADNLVRVLYNVVGSGRTINAGSTAPRGILLAPNNILNHPLGVWKGIVIVGRVIASNQINRFVCPPHPLPPPPPPPSGKICPFYEGSCPGLASTSNLYLPLKGQVVSFKDFDVVAFGNFYGRAGDVEGRVAVQGNLDVDSFSIGLELWTINGPDNVLPYSLIVGHDAQWGTGGGQVYPFGNNIDKHPAVKEDVFVGGTFAAPQYLLDRRTGNCAGSAGCLDQWFNNAKSCYSGQSDAFAAAAPNVVASLVYGGLKLTCSVTNAGRYSVNIPDTLFNQANYYFLDNCNFNAEWVVNIVGNGPVAFTGGSFPAVAGGVLFNVPGVGRQITLGAIGLNGHLLAPGSDLTQTSSVIVGKVVVRNYLSVNQVNRPCPNKAQTTVTVTSFTSEPQPDDPRVQAATNAFVAGDKILSLGVIDSVEALPNGGQALSITGVDGTTLADGTVLTVTVGNVYSPRNLPIVPTPTSAVATAGASSLALFSALIALALALLL